MGENLPVRFQEHVQLQVLGINPQFIGFNNLTMESDKFICVREKEGEQSSLTIVDLSDINNLVKRPITADSAIMHLSEKIIALKAGNQLQIFNLETKSKIKSHQMSENVVFWKWVNSKTLGLVTERFVFHWSLDGDSAPVKAFERHSTLNGCQIINYRTNKDMNWSILIGISARDGGRVGGSMQLYNKDRNVSQPIEAHAAAFGELMMDGGSSNTKLFSFANRTPTGAKLHIVEIDHKDSNPVYPKKQVDVIFPPEATNDFPVSMQIIESQSIIYLVTKYGFIHLYDLNTGDLIYYGRISGDTIFVTAELEELGGIILVNRKGQVLSVSLDENNVVPYILNNNNNIDLALRLASKCNLPGADNLYIQKYNQLFASGNFGEAAKVAATSPNGILRTQSTIEQFKQIPVTPNQTSPILQYFGILLERGELNRFESIELARPVLQQGRKQLLEKWLKENKLNCSEELGDIIKQFDTTLALSVYLRANVSGKVVNAFAELGEYSKIVLYAKKVDFQPDYESLLNHILRTTPEKAAEFASLLVNNETGPLVEVERLVDIFIQSNRVQAATSFVLDALKNNKPEEGHLQTRFLEMALLSVPQVADAILGQKTFTHYDRNAIGSLCEKAGLHQRALEHYSDLYDIKRVLVNSTQLLNPEWVIEYFGTLSVDDSLECLKEMIANNIRQNLQLVVQIASKYSDLLTAARLIELFESFKTYEGLYYYLGAIVNTSQDPEVHFKYIQAGCFIGQMKEVERICRESNYYDGERVKNFFKEQNLSDLLPLILVCDRFDFIHDLILYLYQNNFHKYIEHYVQKINSSRTPVVIGALLDVDCDESIIKNLLMSVQGPFPVDELVEEVEKRNRLKLIRPWLEVRINDSNQDPAMYNALAMIYIDGNNNAEQFLKTNQLYDPRVVGRYCEKRDPNLAFLAYERGQCDHELIQVTNDNSMHKHQARYLIKRQDLELWSTVLDMSNPHRNTLIEQIVNSAISEAQLPEEVSTTVKAFREAGLNRELLDVLEKIVLEPTMFSENVNLQNLMLITAINHSPEKVMGYLERLNNFDAVEVAKISVEYELYEEGFYIYNKYGAHADAVNVLLDHLHDVDRAYEFAERVNTPNVWSKLGKAQLAQSRVKEAVDSYIRSNDSSNYMEVVKVAEQNERYEDLVRYLQMARLQTRETMVDTELLYAFAKTNRISDIESILSGPNIAQVQAVGDRCFNEGLYHAAKILFLSVSNWGSLASTQVRLGEYQSAVDSARKANNTRVWRQVHDICIEQGEYRLSQICGMNLVIHTDELQNIIKLYESKGLTDQLLSLLEASLGLERANMSMFTELTILYTKYRPESVMEHLKLYSSRVSLPKAIKACDDAHLWPELVFCYTHYDEYDNAANTIMKHSASAWEHTSFKDIVSKVNNLEIYYRALQFYLEEQPLLINDLLSAISSRVDHTRVVKIFEMSNNIALIRPYLVSVQKVNNRSVNNVYNQLLIDEEDFESLQTSIDSYDNFDNIELAQRLEKHELLEFRRIAARLYRINKRWEQSIALSKNDQMYRDAMDTASISRNNEIAENLLRFFVENEQKEYFAACLTVCYDLIRPDVAMELAWRHRISDYVMPYMIQVIREYTTKVDRLEKANEERTKREEAKEKQEQSAPIINPGALGNPLMITQGNMGNQPIPMQGYRSNSGPGQSYQPPMSNNSYNNLPF